MSRDLYCDVILLNKVGQSLGIVFSGKKTPMSWLIKKCIV